MKTGFDADLLSAVRKQQDEILAELDGVAKDDWKAKYLVMFRLNCCLTEHINQLSKASKVNSVELLVKMSKQLDRIERRLS